MRARYELVVGLCLFGCSSQDQSDDGGKDASDAVADVTVDASLDTSLDTNKDSGTGCNALSNIGTVIQQMYVPTNPVTGTGGVVASGTYVMTAAAVYSGIDGGSGPTGTRFVDTVLLDGGGYQRVASIVDDAGLDGSPIRQNGAFALDGSSIQLTQTCPPGNQPFTSYDSDGTKLRLYAPPVMFEYTKK